MANFGRKLIYKIYEEDGTFISVLPDVTSDLSIERVINGGDSEFSFILARKFDDFSENTEIKFNNRVKVYVQDEYHPNGDKLVAYGYIVSYSPVLRDNEEYVEVTCLSAVSKLANDFYRTGTASAASELGVELLDKRADEMMEEIVTHYRSVESNPMISDDFSSASATTDNDGNTITFDHRFFNMKHLDALREASKFLPRNREDGHFFYWRISTDGRLIVQNLSTAAQHNLVVGKHIREIDGSKTITDVINKVYFWNEKGTSSPEYIKLNAEDSTSQDDFDIIAEYISDSKITTASAANLLASSRVYDKKDAKVKVTVTLTDNYDLASIEPGQTCQILNTKNNPYKIGSNPVLLIDTIRYNVDNVTLELTEFIEDFADVVEEERQRLDKQLKWFGKITQDLTAAQLAPANRVWTTNISFSATTGANAYRQVDWTEGNVYIPTGDGTVVRRVIATGNTGLMSGGSVYYVYLDEDNLPTGAVTEESGTADIVKGGDELVDTGSPGWSSNQWAGYIVEIGGQKRIIKSNTASVLVIEDSWTIDDQTSAYTIKKFALSTTSTATDTMYDTRIVFTNAKANPLTTSEASITPIRADSIKVAGQDVAKKSISADQIIANSITANEIDTGSINIGVWSGDLDDVDDGTDFKKTTTNEKTGAGRAYNGLSILNRITNGFLAAGLTSVSAPTDGVRIDSNGIYGFSSSSATFYISASTGDAYFKGLIEASTIIGGTIRTSSSGINVVLSGDDDAIKFQFSDTVYAQMYPNPGAGNVSVVLETISSDASLVLQEGVSDYIGLKLYGSDGIEVIPDNVSIVNSFVRLPNISGATAAGMTPYNGSMYYRTDDHVIRVYVNGSWETVQTS